MGVLPAGSRTTPLRVVLTPAPAHAGTFGGMRHCKRWQVVAVDPGQTPPVQVAPAAQVPHSCTPPQPSPMLPQNPPTVVAAGQASVGQLGPPTHNPFSHTWSPGQAPQSCVPLQPSPMVPQ